MCPLFHGDNCSKIYWVEGYSERMYRYGTEAIFEMV